MNASAPPAHFYVVKSEDIPVLNYLRPGHPKPSQVTWVNRATDQEMRRSSVDQFMRTLFKEGLSESATRLHDETGLRLTFPSEAERNAFATCFRQAQDYEQGICAGQVIAVFDSKVAAEKAITNLLFETVPEAAISLLFRANSIMDAGTDWPEGHSLTGILGSVAGAGVAGVAVGMAILVIPGVGPIAAAGALAASAYTSVATVSGIIGATGGAIARMITDPDVDEVANNHLERQIQNGKIFLTVGLEKARLSRADIERILTDSEGVLVRRPGQSGDGLKLVAA
jgi:hypothetical protein